MSSPDRSVKIILIVLILLYFSVLVTGFVSDYGYLLVTILNFLSGISIIVYWVRKQLRIKQHYFDKREILALTFEIIATCCAFYSMIVQNPDSRLKPAAYIFFGIHATALVLFLIFMLTFKIKRLI